MVAGTFFRCIGNRESNPFQEYGFRSRMNVHHIMLKYNAWRMEYTLLCQKLEKKVSQWPGKARQLPGSRKATPAVLDFFGYHVIKEEA